MDSISLSFSTKNNYNKSLRHVKKVNSLMKLLVDSSDVSEFMLALQSDNELADEQILSILNVLIKDRLKFSTTSFNLDIKCPSVGKLVEVVSRVSSHDIILCYHHPQIGVITLTNVTDNFSVDEDSFFMSDYIVAYFRSRNNTSSDSFKEALHNYFKSFDESILKSHLIPEREYLAKKKSSNKVAEPVQEESSNEGLYNNSQETQAPKVQQVEKPAAKQDDVQTAVKLKMTPKYSVQVTNELFHNGNVEAWKNIIESYTISHPSTKVMVFHNGEHINNLNTLFKWGKVKLGDVILFSVKGETFTNISKLQKYLYEGASNRFNKFIKKDLNKPLHLF